MNEATPRHGFRIHGCLIVHAFDNREAVCKYPEASGLADETFTSVGEPTATMQAIHAAKRFMLEGKREAAVAEADAVAAAVETAKQKAAAPTKAKGK